MGQKFLCIAPGADPGGKAAEMRQKAVQRRLHAADGGHHLCGAFRAGRSGLPDGAGLHFAERCHRCDRTGWHRADAGRGSVCQCGLQHIGHHQQCTGSCHGLLWLDGGLRRFPEGSGQADGPAGRPCRQHGRRQWPAGGDAGRPDPPEKEKNAQAAEKKHPQGLAECMAG